MTISNPVVPRLDTVVAPSAQRHEVGVRKRFYTTHFNLWALSDLATIACAAVSFSHLSLYVIPTGSHVFLGAFATSFIASSGCILLFWILGVYAPVSSPLNIEETRQLLRGTSAIAGVMALGASHLSLRLRLLVFVLSGVVGLLLVLQRGLVRSMLISRPEPVRTLIYAHYIDSELFTTIQTIVGNTLEIAGVLSDSPWEVSRDDELPCRIIGTSDDLKRAATHTGASYVLVVGTDEATDDSRHILQSCERLKLHCSILIDPRSLLTSTAYTFEHELPVLRQPPIAVPSQSMQLKRAIDLGLGACLLVLGLPIGILIAVAIKCDSRGPVFFRQKRIGKDGRSFELLKFRSMHTWSPKYHRSPTSDCDLRITRVGRLLRRLSLDELPQLLNVLKGDMSLVGPRPEMPFIVDQYNDAAKARLVVRPGITGLWQISRARAMPIHHNLQYDLFYIERQSVLLDAAILLRTFGAVVRGIGAA